MRRSLSSGYPLGSSGVLVSILSLSSGLTLYLLPSPRPFSQSGQPYLAKLFLCGHGLMLNPTLPGLLFNVGHWDLVGNTTTKCGRCRLRTLSKSVVAASKRRNQWSNLVTFQRPLAGFGPATVEM